MERPEESGRRGSLGRGASQRSVTALLQGQRKPTRSPQRVGRKLPTGPEDVRWRAKGCGGY